MNREVCLQGFASVFGDATDARVFFAPGRVNLIGEHIDYNGGHVLPCALSIGTYLVIKKRFDRTLRFYSDIDSVVHETSLDALVPMTNSTWTAYPCGIVWAFHQDGYEMPSGFDMWVYGTLPHGAGLSSSASLEVATAYALRELFQLSVSDEKIAMLGQCAENRYVGMNCGIMDQFSVAMGKKVHALYLNTLTLQYQYTPLAIKGYEIMIMDSCKKRGLLDSKYNERVQECDKALQILRKYRDVSTLCEADEVLLEKAKTDMTDTLYRRARHVITEERRTKDAFHCLKKGDMVQFGKLMNASHQSLKNDYEVSGKELDCLVESAWEFGVVGARMTGAGFGGCAVAIVQSDQADAFKQYVGERYCRKTPYKAMFYSVSAGSGPYEIER